mmetsp:Transcript_19243/g.39527  ORF Transcript_19243/g.39527 Transcript_19243/m.39527 type:complete len:302 (-) Transcript_19243:1986-2891(-)
MALSSASLPLAALSYLWVIFSNSRCSFPLNFSIIISMRFTLPWSYFSRSFKTSARIKATSSVATVEAALVALELVVADADDDATLFVGARLAAVFAFGRARDPSTWALRARRLAADEASLAVRSSAVFFSSSRSFSSIFCFKDSCSLDRDVTLFCNFLSSFLDFSSSSAASSLAFFSFSQRLAISLLFFRKTSRVLLSLACAFRAALRFDSLSWIRLLSFFKVFNWYSVFCFCFARDFISSVRALTVSSRFLEVTFLCAAPMLMRRTRVANCNAWIDSSYAMSTGVTATIIMVLEFPPKES